MANNVVLVEESYPLLPSSLSPSLPPSLPPSLLGLMEERINTLEIQMIKIKTESDQEIKKMKMDEVKISVSTATKGMRESLDKAETNIADLIKEVSMLAISSPQEQKQILGERLFPLVQRMNPDQSKPHIAGKITGMILEKENQKILQMIENQDDLLKQVKAALDVLAKDK